MADTTIIAATKTSKGAYGEYPSRCVVLKWNGGQAFPFSRHMQVFDGKNDEYFIYGHYHMKFDDALTDMIASMKENNHAYPEGTGSHFPGLDFVKCDQV